MTANCSHDGTVVVIGAGPAGMAAAYVLTMAGIHVELYEASAYIGGMARTIELWGGRVDIGPHRFFSSNRRVNQLWLEVAGQGYEMIDRLTRVFYNGRYFEYPLRPVDALMKLGPVEALRCLGSYVRAQCGRPAFQDASFEDWVVSRFGRRLFEIFFKTYSEKLWGISCSELDADFAAQRIQGLSLWGAIANALKGGRGNRHKTLVDRFAYPVGGTGTIYRTMAERVESGGGRVFLSTPVDRVVIRENRLIGLRLESGAEIATTGVVSSMPLTLLVERIDNVPQDVVAAARSLQFRNTILVYLHIDAVDIFPDNWLYIHAPDLSMGRITNFRNWSTSLHPASRTSILALEYWCDAEDDQWRWQDGRLIDRAAEEIRRTGLLHGATILDAAVVRIPRCYPVYRRGYREHVDCIKQYLSEIDGLQAVGRYGAFKYNNQDHSILMGIMAADNIISGTRQDLWSVNNDYDAYQEGTRITETGLEEH